MEGVAVDLDFNAVKFIMDLNEVDNQFDCFQKVHAMWHYIQSMKRETKK